MAKLDDKALEKLIREVLNESEVDDTLRDQIKEVQANVKLESLKKFSVDVTNKSNVKFDIVKDSNYNLYKVLLGTLKDRADRLKNAGIDVDSTDARDIRKIRKVFDLPPA